MKILNTIKYYRLCSLTEWRMVKGHPRYIVSCNGEVLCWNWCRTGKPRICKLNADSDGYLRVGIDGANKLVHRIVSETFIPNPQNKPCIDHINTTRTDNRVENLRWCTQRENCNNPLSRKHYSKNSRKPMLGKLGDEHHRSKPIIQMALDGKFIKKWACGYEVERELGINHQNITACCRGKRNKAGGFLWMYYSDWLKLQRKNHKI